MKPVQVFTSDELTPALEDAILSDDLPHADCVRCPLHRKLVAEIRAMAEGATRTEHCRALLRELGEDQ